MRQIYFITILVISTIIVFGSIGNMVAYGSNSGGGSSNQRNNACYNAGFTDGRVHPYNQTTYNGCGTNGRAYYEGFLSGCISGQGKDYFSCQKMTNAPTGGGSNSGGGGFGFGGRSNTNGGGGGFDGFGGSGH